MSLDIAPCLAQQVNVADFATPLMASHMTLYLTGHVHLLRSYRMDGASGSKTQVLSGAGCMVQVEEAKRRRASAQASAQEAMEAAEDAAAIMASGYTTSYEETVRWVGPDSTSAPV